VDESVLYEEANVISMSVPLFIRALEYAREDAKNDVALHKFTENAIILDRTLGIDDYDQLVKP